MITVVRGSAPVAVARWMILWFTRIALRIEAFVLLIVVAIALRTLKFAGVVNWLDLQEAAPGLPVCLPLATRPSDVCSRRLSAAVESTSKRMYPQRPCLPGALVGSIMLTRRGIPNEIILGVAHSPDISLSAHAWLLANEAIVTGHSGGLDHVPLVRFARETKERAA